MPNAGRDVSIVMNGIDSFRDRIVAFVDVMGIRDRMIKSETPMDLSMFSQWMFINGHQPFAENIIEAVMFSDCMYFITDDRFVGELISLISNFAYNLLVNRETRVIVKSDEDIEDRVNWDCLKMRGGITYGKVVALDEEAKKTILHFKSNMVLGPAAVKAYELESRMAVYPRIVVDEAFETMLEKQQISKESCYLIRDSEDDLFYLDFWKYMFKEGSGPEGFLKGCIDYVQEELKKALSTRNARLAGQLYWYVNYLKKHCAV